MALARVAAQHITNTGATTTPTATLPGSPTLGNLMLALMSINNGAGDTRSLAGWTLIPTDGAIDSTFAHSFFYKIAGASESATVTGSNSSSNTWRLTVCEWNDSAGGTWTLDKSAHNSGSGTSRDSGTTAATTVAAELWVAGLTNNSGSVSSAPTNGFTSFDGADTGVSNRIYDKVVAATGTANCGDSIATSRPWGGTIATFYSLVPTKSLPPELDRRVRRSSLLARCSGILVPRLWLPEPGELLPAL